MSDATTPTPSSSRGPMLETESRREALSRLTEGLGARDPLLVVTGEAGTGKTALVRDAVARWGARAVVAFVANTTLTRIEFLEHVVRRFGMEPPANATKPQLLDRLEHRMAEAEGSVQVPVIVVDDAHQLDAELLDELRQLANVSVLTQRPLEIVLVGLPALEERLAEPALEALRQRISVRCTVSPLSHQETRRYLHEVILVPAGKSPEFLPKRTSREIFKRTGGVPRAINSLVGEAIRHASAANATELGAEHLALAAGALDGPIESASPAKSASPPAPRPATVAPVPMAPAAASNLSAPSQASTPDVAEPAPTRAAPAPPASPAPVASAPEHMPHASSQPGSTDPIAEAKPTGPKTKQPESVPREIPPAPVAAHGTETDETSTRVVTPSAESNDPRVREWISRFRKPDEAPFASLLLAASAIRESAAVEFDTDHGPAGEPAAEGAAPPMPRMIRGTRRNVDRRRSGRHRAPMSPLVPLAAAALLALIAIGVFVVPPLLRREAPPPAESTAAGDSADTETRSPRGRRRPAPESRAARVVREGSQETGASAASSASGTAPVSKSEGMFALEVGRYQSRDWADDERTTIMSDTGLKGWLVRDVDGDGVETYRVVIGSYSSRERAEMSAETLLRRGVVSTARVIPLPPRKQRLSPR